MKSFIPVAALAGLVPMLLEAEPRLLEFETQTRDPQTGQVIRRQETVDSRKLAIVIIAPWNYH